MTPDERQDLNEFLAELYTTIRRHEEALATAQITNGALVQALGRIEPQFQRAYTEAFEALRSGEIGQALPVQLGLIDAVIRGLRKTD